MRVSKPDIDAKIICSIGVTVVNTIIHLLFGYSKVTVGAVYLAPSFIGGAISF